MTVCDNCDNTLTINQEGFTHNACSLHCRSKIYQRITRIKETKRLIEINKIHFLSIWKIKEAGFTVGLTKQDSK